MSLICKMILQIIFQKGPKMSNNPNSVVVWGGGGQISL